MKRINNGKDLVDKIKSLELPMEDYAVFGSAPMYAMGLIDRLGDIDVVAVGQAWEKIAQAADEVFESVYKGYVAKLFNGAAEAFSFWMPGEWDTTELFEHTFVYDGVRYVSLEYVLMYKKILRRRKDKRHINLLENYFAKN